LGKGVECEDGSHGGFLRGMKRIPLLFLQCALMALALPAAAEFTQADLQKMVTELDKVIPENPKFKYPIKCSVDKDDEVNAYATLTKEGEDHRATMVVHQGLVTAIGGDERLIRAVVAHELSHLSLGHVLDIDPAARDLKNLWTRQQEFEADKYGAIALEKSGHAKKDMVDMLLFLEGRRSRNGDWLGRLTADHADPKFRAAEVSDDPTSLKALLTFDTALAYEDARSHLYAQLLFESAAEQWPALTEAYINAGKCGLLFYYDNLAVGVRNAWWRPDFGPLITTPHVASRGGSEITDEDRERYKDAMESINKAVSKNGPNSQAQELLALAQVLEPDAKKDVVDKGIAWFEAQAAASADAAKLRYANNAGLGYQREGNLQKAYETIMVAQKTTGSFNQALGENMGLVKVSGRSKEDDKLAADVMFTWLNGTTKLSDRWDTVKKTFDEVCTTAGITPKPIEPQPAYLCKVTTLVTSGKELGLFLPEAGVRDVLGTPGLRTTFTKRYPDLAELRWHEGNISVFTERGNIMRLTSYEPGAYLVLKPVDKTSQTTIQIKVGMTKAELWDSLNEKASVQKDLAKAGQVETWTYFPSLNMGVLIDGDKIKAITVSPVVGED
jgi:hypothetical protein